MADLENVVSSLLAMILIFYTCVLAMLEVIYSLCRGKEETAVKGKVNAVSKGKGIDVKIADIDEQKEKVIFRGKGKDVKIVDTEEQKEAKRKVIAQLKAEKATKEQAKKERDAAAAKAKAKKKEDRKKNQKKAQASSSENFEANYIGNLKNL